MYLISYCHSLGVSQIHVPDKKIESIKKALKVLDIDETLAEKLLDSNYLELGENCLKIEKIRFYESEEL